MGLLDRVGRLVRANLNDLVDRAEDPQKMLKQVILDMENQLMQVKTQVAVSVADRHLLEKKLRESTEAEAEAMESAESCLSKGREDLARAAVAKALNHRRIADGFRKQVDNQSLQVEHLKTALRNLEGKLIEAQNKSELLLAQHRRARVLGKAADARVAMIEGASSAALARMKEKVYQQEALGEAKAELAADSVEEQALAVSQESQIDRILREIKTEKH